MGAGGGVIERRRRWYVRMKELLCFITFFTTCGIQTVDSNRSKVLRVSYDPVMCGGTSGYIPTWTSGAGPTYRCIASHHINEATICMGLKHYCMLVT